MKLRDKLMEESSNDLKSLMKEIDKLEKTLEKIKNDFKKRNNFDFFNRDSRTDSILGDIKMKAFRQDHPLSMGLINSGWF